MRKIKIVEVIYESGRKEYVVKTPTPFDPLVLFVIFCPLFLAVLGRIKFYDKKTFQDYATAKAFYDLQIHKKKDNKIFSKKLVFP